MFRNTTPGLCTENRWLLGRDGIRCRASSTPDPQSPSVSALESDSLAVSVGDGRIGDSTGIITISSSTTTDISLTAESSLTAAASTTDMRISTADPDFTQREISERTDSQVHSMASAVSTASEISMRSAVSTYNLARVRVRSAASIMEASPVVSPPEGIRALAEDSTAAEATAEVTGSAFDHLMSVGA